MWYTKKMDARSARTTLRRIGEELYKYYTKIYNNSDIYLLLDKDTFNNIINAVEYNSKKIDFDSCGEFFKSVGLNYNVYESGASLCTTSIDGEKVSSNSLIALAIAVYQTLIFSEAQACDEQSFYAQIEKYYGISGQEYFKKGNQRSLWECVRILLSYLAWPDNPLSSGTSGCNVQYPKCHRLFSASDFSKCRNNIFPVFKKGSVTSEQEFFEKSKEIKDKFNFTVDFDQKHLKILYTYYCYWKDRNTTTTAKKTVPGSSKNITQNWYVLDFDEDTKKFSVLENGLPIPTIPKDPLIFYSDGSEYTTQEVRDCEYFAVLTNTSAGNEKAYAVTIDDYGVLIFNANEFSDSEYGKSLSKNTPLFYFTGGIALERHTYIKGHLPTVHCTKNITNITIKNDNQQFFESLSGKQLDLQSIASKLQGLRTTFKIPASDGTPGSLSFNIQENPSKIQNIKHGWNYELFQPEQ